MYICIFIFNFYLRLLTMQKNNNMFKVIKYKQVKYITKAHKNKKEVK